MSPARALRRLILPLCLAAAAAGCRTGTARGPAPELLATGKEYYAQGEFRRATRYFRGVVRRHPEALEAEEAQFLLAETYRMRRKGSESFNAYQKLFEDFPNSRYAVAAAMGEYQLGLDYLEGRTSGFLFFAPPRAPGVDVLEHMQIHSRNHSHADDALMRVADYHLAEREYEEATYVLRRLLSEYPRSEFALRARFQLGRSLWLDNQGPDYDVRLLEQSRRAFEDFLGTLRMDGVEASYGEQIEATQAMLAAIRDRLAEREYRIGRFYERTGYPSAAAHHYRQAEQEFAGTDHATRSSERLARLRAGVEG